jgi:hypothetical protein
MHLTTACNKLEFEAKSEANLLSNNSQNKEARCLGAKKITFESHLDMIDKVSRREIIQIEEDDDDDALESCVEDLLGK